jgi:hypothetical protein
VDDELWEEIWERTLDAVERHRIARTTMLRGFPLDPLEKRLVPELARRWRRSARNHAIGHLIWFTFFSAIALSADASQPAETFGTAMASFSAFVVSTMLAARFWLAPVTRYGRPMRG